MTADTTSPLVLSPKSYIPPWTAEELALLWREYDAWALADRGTNKAPGLMQHLMTLLPGRSWSSIKYRLRVFLRTGKLPRKRQKQARTITQLQLTQAELGWLAGIVDGEGSFSLKHYDYRDTQKRLYGTASLHCILCYNNDLDIIHEVHRLVPFASIHMTNKAGTVSGRIRTRRDVYCVKTTSYHGAYEVLRHILPYLHGRKRVRALVVWEFVRARVEGFYGARPF